MGAYANRLGAKVFSGIFWHGSRNEKKLYLTFDDGPTEKLTRWILKQLEKYGAHATFFCSGCNVEQYPEQYREIIYTGNQTGNHSHSHRNGWFTNSKRYIQDITRAEEIIHSSLFRPPYGKLRITQLQKLKKDYRIVMWDILTRDYDQRKSPRKIMRYVKKNLRNGSVLVFHDSVQAERNLRVVLPWLLEEYSRKGFEFSLIPAGDKPSV